MAKLYAFSCGHGVWPIKCKCMQYIAVNTNTSMIKFLQGSVVTQTTLGGLCIYLSVANGTHMCVKIAKIG